MKKYITKAELKGYDFSNFWNNELFNDLNRKDENGYNYFCQEEFLGWEIRYCQIAEGRKGEEKIKKKRKN